MNGSYALLLLDKGRLELLRLSNPKPFRYSPKIIVPALGVSFSSVDDKLKFKIFCVIIHPVIIEKAAPNG